MGQLDDTIGAIFVGLVLAAVLHGVTLSQAWHYFGGQGRQFQDPVGLKTLVAVVVAIDVVTQVSATVWLYENLITNFGNLSHLTRLPPSYLGMAMPTGFVTLLVQHFYIWRMWKLAGKNWFVPGFLSICSIAMEASHLCVMVGIIRTHDSKVFAGALNKLVIAVNAIGAALDAVIAIAMVYFLARQRTRVKKTNRILRQIAVHTLTTGAATSICAATVFILLIVLPFTQYELLFYQMLTRMYANSLLATLNVRDSIRTNMTHGNGVVTSSGRVTDRFPEFTAPAFATDTVTAGSYRLNDLKSIQTSEHHEGISIKVDTSTNVI